MKLKVFIFCFWGLIDVIIGATLPKVGLHKTKTVVSGKNTVSLDNLVVNYRNIVVSVPKIKSRKGIDVEFFPSKSLTISFINILSDDEIDKYLEDLQDKEGILYFLCKDEILDYIIKNQVNNVKFFRKNCIEQDISSYFTKPINRKLMQKEVTEPQTDEIVDKPDQFGGEQGSSNKDFANSGFVSQGPHETNLKGVAESIKQLESEGEKSSCCFKKSKNKLESIDSAIPDNFQELLEENKSVEFDGFDITETVRSQDGSVNFEIEITEKNSIFNEILDALKSESESVLEYESIEVRDLSSSELKEALKETEREINNRKVEVRTLRQMDQIRDENSDSRQKSLRSVQSVNLKIKNEISGIPLLKIAERLTQRFIQTKDSMMGRYITPTKTKLLYLSIYQYLIIHSTLDDNLEMVVQIINSENGIPKLRSFFGNYVNFAAIKYVFEQFFARFDHAKEKRVYYKSDFTRFMLNLNTNKTNPKLTSPIFNLKLEIGSLIIFSSEDDPEMQKIIINEEINNTNKQAFFRDNVFFNFLLVKRFSIGENDNILNKANEIIVRNRNNNPLDRPKQCFQQVKQILLEKDTLKRIQYNEEILKVICLQTYGLLGLYSIFD